MGDFIRPDRLPQHTTREPINIKVRETVLSQDEFYGMHVTLDDARQLVAKGHSYLKAREAQAMVVFRIITLTKTLILGKTPVSYLVLE